MDLWVVAAAAGAGYIAKNLQNLSTDKKESPGGPSYKNSCNIQSESRNFLQQLRDQTCPLRRLAQKRTQDDGFLEVKDHSDVNFSGISQISNRDTEAGVTSDALERNRMHEDYNLGWISSMPPSFSAEESSRFEDGENRNFSRVNRGKIIRNGTCRVHSMRAANSFGSIADAQLCRENDNMEDNICIYPSMSAVRPVLITDGSRMISQSGSDSSFAPFEGYRREVRRENGVSLKVCNTMSKCSSLEQFESVEELQREPEKASGNGRSFHTQGPESMLLFMTGITVGIMSATSSWKNEVDKLNKQLKQMQNLVQDLHEEIDMKEMLMVKELTDEGHPPQEEINMPHSIPEPIASPSDAKENKLSKLNSLKAKEKNIENLELLSKIEAELQAELEMLEQSLKASALERISSAVELDPDFEPDIVQGDLKPIMANGTSESGNETTDTATTNVSQPANYAISPLELSLRLHELIESRLETRIKELEIALLNTQNRVESLGSQSIVPGRRFSYSRTEFPSACTCDQHDKREDGPLAENFSRNYSNAYGKPDGLLLRMTDLDQEKDYDSFSHRSFVGEEDRSVDLVQDMAQIWDKQTSTSFMSNEDCVSEDEDTDESDMLLIKQIVERRKSGSSLNLKIDLRMSNFYDNDNRIQKSV